MPQAMRFSKKLQDKLGDEAAGELIDMLSALELAQRTDTREWFDSRFATLEARRAQATAELRAELRTGLLEVKNELRSELKTEVADLRDRIGAVEKRLIGWMFGFWIGTVATLLAILRT